MSKFIKISALRPYDSLLEALMDISGLSRQQVKKFYQKPSKLNAKVPTQKELNVPVDLINYMRINSLYTGPTVTCIYEDENFLILNKPAGVHMHPLTYSDTNNMVSYVINQNANLERVNSSGWDRGFVYRLDQETSGVVYYAKSTETYNKVRENFKAVVEAKYYLAQVEGNFQFFQKLTHSYNQAKGANKVEIEPLGGLQNVTIEVSPLQYNEQKNETLVRVKLSEGKRHQIRAQLGFSGHPIVGDELYGAKASTRVYLHCEQYVLHFDSKIYNFKSTPQNLFKDFKHFD